MNISAEEPDMPISKPSSNDLQSAKISSASIVGATDESSARIWVRTYIPGNWQLFVSDEPFRGDLHEFGGISAQKYFEKTGQNIVYSKKAEIKEKNDQTHVFDVEGLKAGTKYYYIIASNNRSIERRTEIGIDTPRSFSTMPKSPTSIAFGFYSCHDPISADGSYGAWPHFKEALRDSNALFVIGGGDQTYVDTNKKNDFPDIWEWLKRNKFELLKMYKDRDGSYDKEGLFKYMLDLYRWYYRVYWKVPPLLDVYANYPQYMIWDDHEIMDGWGSLTKTERLNKIARFFRDDDQAADEMLIDLMWKAARKAYFEYEHSHNPKTSISISNAKKCQWDYSFSVSKCNFFVLDMRGHHDVEKSSGSNDPYRLLGKEQMKRFIDWLEEAGKSSSKALYVVSPVPVVHWREKLVNLADIGTVKDDFMDEWDHETNHQERKYLLEHVFDVSSRYRKPVLFLSGDVHCASAFSINDENNVKARVYQVTSSAISRKPAPGVAEVMISNGGKLGGCDGIFSERIFALTGSKNFIISKADFQSDHPKLSVDLFWPGGSEGELVRKRLDLE